MAGEGKEKEPKNLRRLPQKASMWANSSNSRLWLLTGAQIRDLENVQSQPGSLYLCFCFFAKSLPCKRNKCVKGWMWGVLVSISGHFKQHRDGVRMFDSLGNEPESAASQLAPILLSRPAWEGKDGLGSMSETGGPYRPSALCSSPSPVSERGFFYWGGG